MTAAATRTIVLLALIGLSGCSPRRIRTAPSADRCPAGYRFLYTDYRPDGTTAAVCGRIDA